MSIPFFYLHFGKEAAMKKIKIIYRAITLFTFVVIIGCGGGGDGTGGNDSASPSIDDAGTVINLRDGGLVGTLEGGIYFPPQDIDALIKVTVSGSGESESNPLYVDIFFVDESGAVKASKLDSTPSTNIIFNPILNQTTTQTPGTYGSIGGILLTDGTIYSCTQTYPAGGTIVEGAVLGPDGRQYVGCVKADIFDRFKANFYIKSDSVNDLTDELKANIKVLGKICSDRDCGDLAEPIDMMDLYGAYKGELDVGTMGLGALIDSHTSFTNTFMIAEIRGAAYESMLFELFTQKYLWQDYQSKIEEFSDQKIGLPEWVRTFTEDVKKISGYTNNGKQFLRLTPDVIRGIRDILGWSKYATFKNVLNRVDKYLGWISNGATFTIDVEDGVFEWFLYQILGDSFTENYIETFEARILPNVKDPELKTAFINIKNKIIGTNPDGSDGLLHNDIMQIWQALIDTGAAVTYDFVKISLGAALKKYISTGLGQAASASGGIISSAGPGILAGVIVAGLDDQGRFYILDAPLLIALATFMHNNYSSFDLFNEGCPTSDSENEDLLSAQNMFYAARLFFSLLKENYARWFIEASSVRQDFYQWIGAQIGLGSDGVIWTLNRNEEVSKSETKYAAKTVKAMEMLFTCDKTCPAPISSMFSYDCSAVSNVCTDYWKKNHWDELINKLNNVASQYPALSNNTNKYNILVIKAAGNKIDNCGARYYVTGGFLDKLTIKIEISDDAPFNDADFADTVKFIACHEAGHAILPYHAGNGLVSQPTLDEQIMDWFAHNVCGYTGENVRAYNAYSSKNSLCNMDPRADSAISGTDCDGNQCGTCCFYFNAKCRGAMTMYWDNDLLSLDDYLAVDNICAGKTDCNIYEEAAKYGGAADYNSELSAWKTDELMCTGGTCTNVCTIGQTKCEAGKVYSCITNASGCRVWDSGAACATGVCAADGLQCNSCTNACSAGEVKCTAGRKYTCTTNASGCRVWDAGTACPSGSCADATRCGDCTPHHHNACYDHDVYSYDNCNMLESKVTECGVSDWTGSTSCNSQNVYQNYVTRDCANAACTTSTAYILKQNCNGAGCLNGACCPSHTSYKCYNDDVYWYSYCDVLQDKKQECGSSTAVGSNYCYDNDVYKDYDVGGCTTDHCTTTRQRLKQSECGTGGCQNGLCCVSNSTKQCYNGDVYWYDSCGRMGGVAIDCDATQTCSVDKCLCAQTVSWTNNTLTATIVTGGVSLSWNPAPSTWIHHYKVARAPGDITPSEGWAISPNLTVTSYLDQTGVKGQTYRYVVFGYDSCGVNRNASTMVTKVFP